MDPTMSMMRKALSTGAIAAVREDTMSRSTPMRPKSRTTRNARSERSTLMGILTGPRAMSERATTAQSKAFQPSRAKGRNQWA